MDIFTWPYCLQAKMSRDGYLSITDLADRWDTPEKARAQAEAALTFPTSWGDGKKALMAMKVMQAVRKASAMVKDETGTIGVGTTLQSRNPISDVVVAQNKRHTMEAEWTKKTGLPPPPLDEQPSDAMIKTQWAFCETGTLGFVDTNKIVSALPLPTERGTPTKKRKVEGLSLIHI